MAALERGESNAFRKIAAIPSRDRLMKRWSALKQDRSSWESHYRELGDYILPRRLRLEGKTWRNRGTKRNDKIYNGAATLALRSLRSGLQAGLTSPSRPWFRLTVPDPALTDLPEVKQWLYIVEDRIRTALHKSNVYNSLASLYGDLAVYGISPLYTEAHPATIVRSWVIPVGEYWVAADELGRVNTVYHETQLTVFQLVRRFGYRAVSTGVRDKYDRGDYDIPIDVLHVVEPRTERDPEKDDRENMPWASYWLEIATDTRDTYLAVGGYQENPYMVPRWDITGSDVYGTSPAMEALPDIKSLQYYERRKAQVMDKIVTPPMIAPASMQRTGLKLLAGDTTYVAKGDVGAAEQIRPAVQIDTRAALLREEIAEYTKRINQAFYADLFTTLLYSDLRQPRTATEIAELHEEKVLQLGPQLQRLDDELLRPLIDRFFFVLYRRGDIPPAPPVLEGEEYKVVFESILATAQKLVGIANIERATAYIGNVAQTLDPQARDKFDVDAAIDDYAERVGIAPSLVRPTQATMILRQARAKMQQQAAMMQAAPAAKQMTGAMKDLSEIPEDDQGETALGNILQRMSPGLG
jgi:hypothetical protein